jgi:hypothetical protein
MTRAIKLIEQERNRQINQENFDASHDDQQTNGGLAIAAACYAIAEDHRENYRDNSIPSFWPWQENAFKPSPDNRIKELTKAGALIAAEIDRLLRIEQRNKPHYNSDKTERIYNDVYEHMEQRLNQLGEIRTDEAWSICQKQFSYSAITVAFRKIMLTMVEQGKAQKIKNGHYKIIRSNTTGNRQLATSN